MRIAFFGGTFDPPHCGHIAEARAALAADRTDRVLFVPAYAPPHKDGRPIRSFADRLRMAELATAGEPGMAVSDIERELAFSPSYTFRVLEVLAQRFPGDRWQLLIGGDSLALLHEWHRGREIAARWEVLTYPRAGCTPSAAELTRNWPPELAAKLAAGQLAGDFWQISSTEIRKKLANGEIPATVIPRRVREYLEKRRLYAGRPTGEER